MKKIMRNKNGRFVKGHIHSEETIEKISEANKGQNPWNKGKRMDFNEYPNLGMRGKKHSKEALKKLSESHKGYIVKEETKRKLSNIRKGYKHSEEAKKNISIALQKRIKKLGYHHSKETIKKISKTLKGRFIGKNNPNWNNGTSFEPYGIEFNNQLKEFIRKRDNFRCQQCFRNQDELFRNTVAGVRKVKLDVHHIDFNKRNNNPNNLISLCHSCHMQTQFNREEWINYFQEKLNDIL